MAKTLEFRNVYNCKKQKPEFFTKYSENAKDLTDQSQYTSASIVEMAKKFGIDAIIAKAEQRTLENQAVLDKLYGNDFTKMFKSKEDLLNVKRNVANMFELIPARIRKETFNDDINNFVNAYATNDEKSLKVLNNIGIVSDTQLNAAKSYNAKVAAEKAEQETRINFINKLETMKEGLYEKFKETGNININSNNDISQSAGDV